MGVVAGSVVAGVWAYFDYRRFAARGAQLQVALTSDGGALEAAMLTSGDKLQADLTDAARSYGAIVAQRTADQVLADTYGLTESRLTRLAQLETAVQSAAGRF